MVSRMGRQPTAICVPMFMPWRAYSSPISFCISWRRGSRAGTFR